MRVCLFIPLLLCLVNCDSPIRNKTVLVEKAITGSSNLETFAKHGITLQHQWLVGPFGSIKKENHLLVLLFDENKNPVSLPANLTLFFYSTMPSMGHPMEDAGIFEELDTGIYLNKTIRFNMGEEWRHELWLMNENQDIVDKVQWYEVL